MSKEPRGAVISIRLSEDEQTHLRAIATEQGTSVSDVVRGFVADSIGPDLPRGQSSASASTLAMNEGVFWRSDSGVIDGATVTIDLSPDE